MFTEMLKISWVSICIYVSSSRHLYPLFIIIYKDYYLHGSIHNEFKECFLWTTLVGSPFFIQATISALKPVYITPFTFEVIIAVAGMSSAILLPFSFMLGVPFYLFTSSCVVYFNLVEHFYDSSLYSL